MRVITWKVMHYKELCAILRMRDAYVSPLDEIPELGWLAVNEDTIIAAAFLRRVEGNFAQLDGLTSNPSLPGETRDKGLDAVLEAAMAKARELGFKSVLGTTLDKNTLSRAQRHGFKPVPMTVVICDTSVGDLPK